jgi:hypothetical protein
MLSYEGVAAWKDSLSSPRAALPRQGRLTLPFSEPNMSAPDERTPAPAVGLHYRLPMTYWLAGNGVILAVLLLFEFIHSPRYLGLADAGFISACVAVYGIIAYTLGRCVVAPDGLRLYLVNHTRWDEITVARKRRVFFLPYLHLQRRRGFNWWVPLYFTGPEPIEDALLRYTPREHPIQQHLQLRTLCRKT